MEHLRRQECGLAVGRPAQPSHRLDSNPGPLPPKVPCALSFVACIGSMPTSEGSWWLNECMQVKYLKLDPPAVS